MDCVLAVQQREVLAELGSSTLFLTYLFGGPAGQLLFDYQSPSRVNYEFCSANCDVCFAPESGPMHRNKKKDRLAAVFRIATLALFSSARRVPDGRGIGAFLN
jgi:hypothetical protein